MQFIDLSVTIRNQSFEPGRDRDRAHEPCRGGAPARGRFNFLRADIRMAWRWRTNGSRFGPRRHPRRCARCITARPARASHPRASKRCRSNGATAPACVLDFSHKKAGQFITRGDIVAAAWRKSVTSCRRGEIVLLRTDTDKHFDNPAFPESAARTASRRPATDLWIRAFA